jgi:hypothetical protein
MYLRRKDAAAYLTRTLGVPTTYRTLDQYAYLGSGPPFRRIGRRCFYAPDDLRRWVETRSSEKITGSWE